MSNVIPIIAFQDAYYRRLVCRDCNYQSSEYIAVDIKPINMKCGGCGKTGFVVWWHNVNDKYS